MKMLTWTNLCWAAGWGTVVVCWASSGNKYRGVAIAAWALAVGAVAVTGMLTHTIAYP